MIDTPSLGPITLVGPDVRLEPLRHEHVADLLPALEQPEIWQWLSYQPRNQRQLAQLVARAIDCETAGTEFAFAVMDAGRAVGVSRYLDVDPRYRSVEIGGTWYLRSKWGTGVNAEAKLLLLGHAFETWKANRVFLKTDSLNARSRAAIERLGAVHEGTLRNHMLRPDGSLRHSAYYSILPDEWPAVRERLQTRIAANYFPREN